MNSKTDISSFKTNIFLGFCSVIFTLPYLSLPCMCVQGFVCQSNVFGIIRRLLTQCIIPRIYVNISTRVFWQLKCNPALECYSTVLSVQLLHDGRSVGKRSFTGARSGYICSSVLLCVAFGPIENRKPISRVADATPYVQMSLFFFVDKCFCSICSTNGTIT